MYEDMTDQFCHMYYQTGYEQGKADTIEKVNAAISDIEKEYNKLHHDHPEGRDQGIGLCKAIGIIRQHTECDNGEEERLC